MGKTRPNPSRPQYGQMLRHHPRRPQTGGQHHRAIQPDHQRPPLPLGKHGRGQRLRRRTDIRQRSTHAAASLPRRDAMPKHALAPDIPAGETGLRSCGKPPRHRFHRHARSPVDDSSSRPPMPWPGDLPSATIARTLRPPQLSRDRTPLPHGQPATTIDAPRNGRLIQATSPSSSLLLPRSRQPR